MDLRGGDYDLNFIHRGKVINFHIAQDDLARKLISYALGECGNNVRRAALFLGLSPKGIWGIIKRLEMDPTNSEPMKFIPSPDTIILLERLTNAEKTLSETLEVLETIERMQNTPS